MAIPHSRLSTNRAAVAWLLLMTACALHVIDEALTGFLPFFNQVLNELRGDLGLSPIHGLSFGVWLGVLALLLVVGFAITPLMRRGGMIMRAIALLTAILMIINSGAHIVGSFYKAVLLPGFWSSPLLLASAVFMVIRGLNRSIWSGSSSRPT